MSEMSDCGERAPNISNDLLIALISAVQQIPLLWDITLPEYQKSRCKQGQLWNVVANSLTNLGYRGMDGHFCQKEWQNLRRRYVTKRKFIQAADEAALNAAKTNMAKSWPLFSALDFLFDLTDPNTDHKSQPSKIQKINQSSPSGNFRKRRQRRAANTGSYVLQNGAEGAWKTQRIPRPFISRIITPEGLVATSSAGMDTSTKIPDTMESFSAYVTSELRGLEAEDRDFMIRTVTDLFYEAKRARRMDKFRIFQDCVQRNFRSFPY